MSLSRKLLESLGLESDKVSTIIEAHAETVDGLKAEIEKYKDSANKYETTKRELDTLQTELDSLKSSGGDWQKKYEKEHSDFEAYKTDREAQEALASKKSAYGNLLKQAGVSEKSIEKILKVTDLSGMEMEDGKFKEADKLTEAIKADWSEFITQSQTSGAQTQTPPATNTTRFTSEEIAKMSPDEINKNWESIKLSMKGNE